MNHRLPSARLRVRLAALGCVSAAALWVAGCAQTELSPHLRPLSKESMMLLGKKGMETTQPIFIRIFKEESELEVWKQRADGHYYHFKSYPICAWSGELGPKIAQGDKQAPEGFYQVSRNQMNPNSKFHLAFNLGYPNAFDKAHRRTGDALMVHGKCASAGCYAMTDALMEEIYALARESFIGGQETIHVHAFPFRMTEANLTRHKASPWMPFWMTLKEGYDHFEMSRRTPEIAVCQRQYKVNVKPVTNQSRIDADGPCPRLEKLPVVAFAPPPTMQKLAEERIVAPGPRQSVATSAPATWGQRFGLTRD